MSYDISIGGESFNYTSNVSMLFYEHIPEHRDCGGLRELHGLTGKQAGLLLKDAFNRIDRTRHETWSGELVGEPAFCARYDAKNGWGSTVGALIFLSMVMAACFANPRSKVSVWA